MLVIRFFRIGKKNQPSFKIVITDKRNSSTRGRFVEEVGFWNPLTKEKVLKAERIKYWLSVGAKPSPTVYNLLISEKIVVGKKIDVHKKAKAKKEKPGEGAAVAAASTPESALTAKSAEETKPAAVPAAETIPVKEEKKEEQVKEEAPKTE